LTRHQIASPPGDLQLGLEQWACHDHLPSGSSLTVARDDRSRLTPPYGARLENGVVSLLDAGGLA
jgi:hypothetical protein